MEKGDIRSPNVGRSLERTENGAVVAEARHMIQECRLNAGKNDSAKKAEDQGQARKKTEDNEHTLIFPLKLVTVVIVVRVLMTIFY